MNARRFSFYLLAIVGLVAIAQGAYFLHLGCERNITIFYMVLGAMFSILCLVLGEEDKNNKGV